MNIRRDILWRIYLVFIATLIMAGCIIGQVVRIQWVEGTQWRLLADSLTLAYLPVEAERGDILASDGSLLSTSLPYFEVRFDANAEGLSADTFYYHVGALAKHMSEFFHDHSPAYYKDKLIRARKQGKRYLLVRRYVTYPELQVIKSWPIFNKGRNKGGFIVIQRSRRIHPFGELAGRTIGFKREHISVGLEGSFNTHLAGMQGKRLMQRISGDLWVPVNEEEEFSAIHGSDVITTIDIELQDVLEHALLAALDSHKAHHGCAVLMEVATGKIRAIANLGKAADGTYREQYNYAIGEATEPGSTFKLMSALALIEDGYVHINSRIDVEKGRKRFYDREMRDAEDHQMTEITLKKCFEKSSNVCFAKLVDHYYQHDPKKFLARIHQTRLSEPLGIELAGEPVPYVKKPSEKSWSGVTLPWMAVGYEVMLTPLQILAFYNAIANNGTLIRPRIVEKIKHNDITIDSFSTVTLKEKICSENTLRQLRLLLEAVVDSGTATNIRNPHYRIAGKTGTAKLLDKHVGYRQRTLYQASFCGYFPAENPRFSCIVVINGPSAGLYYGSRVAAPVFKEIADKIYATSLDMHQEINTNRKFIANNLPEYCAGHAADLAHIIRQFPALSLVSTEEEWIRLVIQSNQCLLHPMSMPDTLVPDVRGMGLRDALYLLESRGMQVKVIGKGMVKKQSITAGEKVGRKREIIIELDI